VVIPIRTGAGLCEVNLSLIEASEFSLANTEKTLTQVSPAVE
jgi:hypothetical protein